MMMESVGERSKRGDMGGRPHLPDGLGGVDGSGPIDDQTAALEGCPARLMHIDSLSAAIQPIAEMPTGIIALSERNIQCIRPGTPHGLW